MANSNCDPKVAIVAACKVLEVLERQLADVNRDVEESVLGVCNGFQGMAQRAQAAVHSVQDVAGVGKEGRVGAGSTDSIHEVLQFLLTGFQLACDFSHEVSAQLERLETRCANLEREGNEFEKNSIQNGITAHNEPTDSKRLAKDGTIENSIRELKEELRNVSEKNREQALHQAGLLEESKRRAHHLLSELQVAHQTMMESIERTSEFSSQLRDDIGKSVMSMQFQDRISQRIGHVISTINGLVSHVMPTDIKALEQAASAQSDRWLAEFAASYTMDAERMALSDGSSPSAPVESSIELF